MLGVLRDYLVTFLREEYIAERAMDWRRTGRGANLPDFNIVDFIENTLTTRLSRKKGKLRIEFFDLQNETDPPAYVTIDPLTLWVDQEVWELARLGDPQARHILAHEVGHLVLHGHYEKAAFSTDPKLRLKSFVKERSAEWQAETFAEHFLLPARLVASYYCARELAAACSVPLEMVEKRIAEVREASLRKRNSSDFCSICGNIGCTETH